MSKRLIVCCDGTWNTPDQQTPTNVTKIALATAPKDRRGREQRTFYHLGVGTNRRERIRGGAAVAPSLRAAPLARITPRVGNEAAKSPPSTR